MLLCVEMVEEEGLGLSLEELGEEEEENHLKKDRFEELEELEEEEEEMISNSLIE